MTEDEVVGWHHRLWLKELTFVLLMNMQVEENSAGMAA